jgi:Negative regulator of sigma F
MSLPPDLKARVLASVGSVPAPTRAETMRARAWLFGCGIVGALIVFFLEGGLRITARPPSLVALTSLGSAIIVGIGIWLLVTRGGSMLGRPRAVLVSAAVLAAAGFVAWKYAISSFYGLTASWPERPGFRCLGLSVAFGALPLAGALLSWRRAAPLTPLATGAAFGAGAGLGSVVLVDLWCPVAYLPHLLLGHVLPIGLLAGLGAILGSRLLRIRRG